MDNTGIKTTLRVASIFIFSLISISLKAQNDSMKIPFKGYLYLQPNYGAYQYFGDLNFDDYWNDHRQFAYGAALGYQLSPVFGLRSQFVKGNLYSERTDQSKVFSTNLWDGAMNLTININEIFAEYNQKRFLNFYLFTGAGIVSYKSKVTDPETGVILAEHTEKQNDFMVPLGAGASFRLSNTFSINLEYGARAVFSGTKLDLTETGMENSDYYSYASAGLQINFGVKDTDGDGIRDKDDLCPETKGKINLAGCPDKDNDGIADKDDACQDIAGKAEFKGCPDTDDDGIIDSEDACPTVFGEKELRGCPDKDNDGIADKDDKCPTVAGRIEHAGCPDRDGDGIVDNEDACPDVKGLAQLNGCPDTDGDGVTDNVDKCPEIAGVAANNGCPEAVKEPVVVLQKIIYFGSDKSEALDKSKNDLNEIVSFIKENPDSKISIAGFADNRESDQYNLLLSEKRADFVINYLKKNGMTTSEIEKLFFGKNNPVTDNSTIEGRALNRRVEIKITK